MSLNPLLIDAARKLVAAARLDDAEYAYTKILDIDPAHAEALQFLTSRCFQRNQFGRAIKTLERAALANPESTDILRGLGAAFKVVGRHDEALNTLLSATRLDPKDYLSRLMLGETLEVLGHSYGALTNYFGALSLAQMAGLWFDETSTPHGQRELVKHATRYVCEGRAQLMANVMSPLTARFGIEAMRRVEASIGMYLGDLPTTYLDDRQRPLFLYFPDLPTHPFFGRDQFPWLPALESKYADIRAELERVLAIPERLEPFHGALSGEQLANYIANARGPAQWDSYFFYRHGERFETHCVECPATIAALDRVPLARVRDHAPESMFSILTPGTHILPHRGVTNTRLVAHLPLIVPDGCAIVVGGEQHVWEEGRVVVFDDTFTHEAWNRGVSTRAVLILDVWNPYLTDAEQHAISTLVPAIGDFNRDCGL